jgi:UDP-N-acetylmuramate dehydrogenase
MVLELSHKSINRAFDRLRRLMPDKVVRDRPLSKYTTLRVGGPAAIFATADTLADVRVLMEAIGDYELPAFILGRGSNMLVSDRGYRGLIFQLGRDFSQVAVEGSSLRAGGAVTLSYLAQAASRHRLGGLEFAVGIPGTVGAATALNAGAHGGEMAQVVRKVTLYSPRDGLRAATPADLCFGYRSCRLPKGSVILEAALELKPSSAERVKAEMETNWRRRKSSQPLDLPNAGSMFKNPEGDFAGRFIEAAGFKGRAVGGAQVSTKHANFFVNTGDATAGDFYRLMKQVAAAVKAEFGVELEPEIRLLGDWSDD